MSDDHDQILGVSRTATSEDIQKSYREMARKYHPDLHPDDDAAKEQFKKALEIGNVNSINIFGKGHHGYSYYNTKIGTRHPNLKFDLLKEQIEACHEMGVTAQVYFTVGWSQKDADDHPEWILKLSLIHI